MTPSRLRRLQQVSAALARALDVGEIARELGVGARALLGASSVFVLHPDTERRTAQLLYGESNGKEIEAQTLTLDDGAVAKAARTGEWIQSSVSDAGIQVVADSLSPSDGSEGLMVAPVVHGRRLLAVLTIAGIPAAALAEGDTADLIRMLASQAAMAMSHAMLFEESERERREIEAMADAARAVGASLRMGEVVRLVLRHAVRLLRGGGGCVAIREGNYVNVVAAAGVAELMAGIHMPLHGSITGKAVAENSVVIVNDVARDPALYRPALRIAAIEKAIVVPLATSRGPVGALTVFNRDEDFGAADARVLQRLADHVAVAIMNARLFEEVTEATRAWTATFDAIGVGLAIVDDSCRIIRYNSRARQIASSTVPGELAGRPFYEAILGAPPSPNDERPLERSLRDGVMVRAVFTVPDSSRRLHLTVAPHLDRGAIVTFDWAGENGEASPA